MKNRIVEKVNGMELKETSQNERMIRKEELEMRKMHLTSEITRAQAELAEVDRLLALFDKKNGEKIEI